MRYIHSPRAVYKYNQTIQRERKNGRISNVHVTCNYFCLRPISSLQPSRRSSQSQPASQLSTMADKLRTIQNLEALQTRYIGTGHADTTKYEWTSNILRDSYSSYVGHPPLLSYMAVGMGEPKEKVRAMMLEKMVRGAGNPPEVCFAGCSEIRVDG